FMLSRSKARLVQSLPPTNVREKCHYVEADLTDSHALERINTEMSTTGRLDVLVLCSWTYERSREPESLARQVAANLLAPYSLIQRLLPLLIKAQGQVVFVNSTQGLKAAAGIGPYAATKHAMKAIADSLRDEINSNGVRVTSIFLGR